MWHGSVEVSSPARIHIALSDLARATGRAYGGTGFAVGHRSIRVRVSTGPTKISGVGLDAAGRAQVLRLLNRLTSVSGGLEIEANITGIPKQHSGLGVKTALLLSIIAGFNRLHSMRWSVPDMQKLAHRGGASGIGLHTFFEGGLVVDAGHPQEEVSELLPSSAQVPAGIPMRLARYELPTAWHVCLLSPAGHTTSGEDEIAFFRRHTPIPAEEAFETIALTVHGVVPAFLDRSLGALATALRRLHEIGFKALEVAAQQPNVRELLTQLQREGFAAGMSSLGPTIYALLHVDDQPAGTRLAEIAEQWSAALTTTSLNNDGHAFGARSET